MLKNFWYACEFSTAVTNQPKNRDVKSEICPLSQLSSTSGSTQRPVSPSRCCSLLAGEKVTVSVVPIMDGNSRRMGALTFLPMHLKHLF